MKNIEKTIRDLDFYLPENVQNLKERISFTPRKRFLNYFIGFFLTTVVVLVMVVLMLPTNTAVDINQNDSFGVSTLGIIPLNSPSLNEEFTKLYFNDQLIQHNLPKFVVLINSLDLELVTPPEISLSDELQGALSFTVEVSSKFLYRFYFTSGSYIIIRHQSYNYFYSYKNSLSLLEGFFE